MLIQVKKTKKSILKTPMPTSAKPLKIKKAVVKTELNKNKFCLVNFIFLKKTIKIHKYEYLIIINIIIIKEIIPPLA